MNLKTLTFTTYLKDGEVCINQDGKDIVVTNLSAGVTVSGAELEEVWQYRYSDKDIWQTVKPISYTRYKDFSDFKSWHEEREWFTRQALHYTGKQAESEQAKEESLATPRAANAPNISDTLWQSGQQFLKDCNVTDEDEQFLRFADFAAGWSKSQSATIKAVLEYVAEKNSSIAYSLEKHQILSLQSEIEQQLSKK